MPALRGLARYQPRYVVDITTITDDGDVSGGPRFWFARFTFAPRFSVAWPAAAASPRMGLGHLGVPRLRQR